MSGNAALPLPVDEHATAVAPPLAGPAGRRFRRILAPARRRAER